MVLILSTLIGLGLREREKHLQGDRNTYSLLAGDRSVRITRLTISGQLREVDCTDPVVLRYFEECLRSHRPYREVQSDKGGITYHLEMCFEDGSRYSGSTFWGKNRSDFFVDKETDVGWPTHAVLFREPLPDAMKRILDFLELPNAALRSQKLVLGPR